MTDEKSRLEQFSVVLKDVVAALRDSVVFLVFVLLLVTPSTINQRLAAAGFTKGSFAGIEWQAQLKASTEQTKTVGQAVSQADDNYKGLIERLGELEKKVNDPSLKASIGGIGEQAQAFQKQLMVADKAIKHSLSAQQQFVEQVSSTSVPDSGWVYLGKVTEEKNKWAPGSPQTVSAVDPLLKPAAVLTITDDAYLRADGPSNSRSSAPILAVLKAGQMVRAVEVDYSHAKGGGWFIWAKVQRI
jgi:hypothetical protein